MLLQNKTAMFSLIDSTLVKVIRTIAYSLLSILTLGGNSLVIAVIYRNRNLRTVINFLILNMAISDLLIPVFALTRGIKLIYLPRREWPLDGVIGSIACKFRPFAGDLSITVSVLTLEVVALERCFSVVFPMKRQPIRSTKTCIIAIALIWLIGAVFSSSYFYTNKLELIGTTPYCIYNWESEFDHAEAVKVQVTIFLVAFNHHTVPTPHQSLLRHNHLPSPTEGKPPFGPASDTTQSRGKQTNNLHAGNGCCCFSRDVAASQRLCIHGCVCVAYAPTVWAKTPHI